MRKMLVAFLCLFWLPVSSKQKPPDKNHDLAQDLNVRLLLDKIDFSAGEPIPVRIQLSNSSGGPMLIGNFISRRSGGSPVSRIEFQLKDARGHAMPAVFEMIDDSFSPKKEPNPATAFLSSYLLLYPGYSLTARFLIRPSLFRGLDKPGYYKLLAVYSSNGLSYSPTYQEAGLSDDDVRSVPFKSWSGKVSTNEVRFRVVPAPRAGIK